MCISKTHFIHILKWESALTRFYILPRGGGGGGSDIVSFCLFWKCKSLHLPFLLRCIDEERRCRVCNYTQKWIRFNRFLLKEPGMLNINYARYLVLGLFFNEWWVVVAQSVRAFPSHAEGCVFESQLLQTEVVKTGSDRSSAKRSALGVSVTRPRRWPL